jgi:hypothetical protein
MVDQAALQQGVAGAVQAGIGWELIRMGSNAQTEVNTLPDATNTAQMNTVSATVADMPPASIMQQDNQAHEDAALSLHAQLALHAVISAIAEVSQEIAAADPQARSELHDDLAHLLASAQALNTALRSPSRQGLSSALHGAARALVAEQENGDEVVADSNTITSSKTAGSRGISEQRLAAANAVRTSMPSVFQKATPVNAEMEQYLAQGIEPFLTAAAGWALLATLVGYTQQVNATTPETYNQAVDRFEMAQAMTIVPAEHQKTLRSMIGAAGDRSLLPEQMDILRQFMERAEAEGMLAPESVAQAYTSQKSTPKAAENNQVSAEQTILAMAALGKAFGVVDSMLDAQIRSSLEQRVQKPSDLPVAAAPDQNKGTPHTTIATHDAMLDKDRVTEPPAALAHHTSA